MSFQVLPPSVERATGSPKKTLSGLTLRLAEKSSQAAYTLSRALAAGSGPVATAGLSPL